MPIVGRFHLIPYGLSIVGPCRADGPCRYGGGPAPVCCPCLGDGVCGWLEAARVPKANSPERTVADFCACHECTRENGEELCMGLSDAKPPASCKDMHVLELDWDKKVGYGQSRRVNRKRLRQIKRSVRANGLTRPAHIYGVRRDGMSDTERSSSHTNQPDRTTAFSRFVQMNLWWFWVGSTLRTWSGRTTRHSRSSLERRITPSSTGTCRAKP